MLMLQKILIKNVGCFWPSFVCKKKKKKRRNCIDLATITANTVANDLWYLSEILPKFNLLTKSNLIR